MLVQLIMDFFYYLINGKDKTDAELQKEWEEARNKNKHHEKN